MDKKIIEYTKKQFSKGKSESELKEYLEKKGYSKEDIIEIFLIAKTPEPDTDLNLLAETDPSLHDAASPATLRGFQRADKPKRSHNRWDKTRLLGTADATVFPVLSGWPRRAAQQFVSPSPARKYGETQLQGFHACGRKLS